MNRSEDALGALVPLPTARFALSAAYLPGRHFFLFAEPAFVVSTPTSPGLSQSVSSVTRWEVLAGVGYDL